MHYKVSLLINDHLLSMAAAPVRCLCTLDSVALFSGTTGSEFTDEGGLNGMWNDREMERRSLT